MDSICNDTKRQKYDFHINQKVISPSQRSEHRMEVDTEIENADSAF